MPINTRRSIEWFTSSALSSTDAADRDTLEAFACAPNVRSERRAKRDRSTAWLEGSRLTRTFRLDNHRGTG